MNTTRYNTDTFGSWGIGQVSLPKDATREEVMKRVIELQANVLVKPKNGKWYIKGFNGKKTYETIKRHLDENQNNGYHSKTKTLLIKHTNEDFDWIFN